MKCQILETSIFVNLNFWNLFESLVWEQTSIEKIEKKGPNLAIFVMNISMRLLANFKHCAKPQKGVKSSAKLTDSPSLRNTFLWGFKHHKGYLAWRFFVMIVFVKSNSFYHLTDLDVFQTIYWSCKNDSATFSTIFFLS